MMTVGGMPSHALLEGHKKVGPTPTARGYDLAKGSGQPALDYQDCRVSSHSQSTLWALCEQEGGGKIPLSVWPQGAG